MRVEHEYERRGAVANLAAYDVHRAKVSDRVTSIANGLLRDTSPPSGHAAHDLLPQRTSLLTRV